MSDDSKSDNTRPEDEAFFSRWSRRKQQAAPPKPAAAAVASPAALQPVAPAEAVPAATAAAAPNPEPDSQSAAVDHPTKPEPLTEADFDDVNFDALSYGSDYGRFMQDGVPESIRQKALSKLWHSDPIFTAVDPFQDYAGDYTDAATVPKSGIVKTAYKVGQGFLSDEEAHIWHRLGKPPLAADMTALTVLVPGVRVRPATADDGAALLAVHTSAILETGAQAYGAALAASWAQGLAAGGYARAMAGGELFELAVNEEGGQAVAFSSRKGAEVMALYVHPRYGRKGIGRELLARAVAEIRSGGNDVARLESSVGARALYERHGFAVKDTYMRASRGGVEMQAFSMRKHLTAPADLIITRETLDQPEVRAFFAASEAYMGALYPAESNHFVDASVLVQPNVVFLVARGGGNALGCGAIVRAADGTAEIKRLWVSPDARGLKLGQRLLEALIAEARSEGVGRLQLETGISQPEALALYRRAGFVEIGAFGDYQPDPLSLFMERAV
jgi:putative acetyltransferase